MSLYNLFSGFFSLWVILCFPIWKVLFLFYFFFIQTNVLFTLPFFFLILGDLNWFFLFGFLRIVICLQFISRKGKWKSEWETSPECIIIRHLIFACKDLDERQLLCINNSGSLAFINSSCHLTLFVIDAFSPFPLRR